MKLIFLVLLVIILLLTIFFIYKNNKTNLSCKSDSRGINSENYFQPNLVYSRGRGVNGVLNIPQVLDLYKPTSVPPDDGYRSVVYIHGGGWVHGDKQDSREISICQTLANNGFVVASINYDLGKGSFPLNLYQCLNGVQYLRSNADYLKLNPDKIAVFGASDGATLACLTGLLYYQQLPEELSILYSDISAQTGLVVSLYAVTNATTRVYSKDEGTVHKAGSRRFGHLVEVLESTMCVSCNDTKIVSSLKLACEDLSGGSPQKLHCLAQIWELSSPALHLPPQIGKEILQTVPPTNWKPPPFLIIHGTGDSIVNHQQADEMAMAIKSIGGHVELIKVPNAPHGFNLETDNTGKKLPIDILDPVINTLKNF